MRRGDPRAPPEPAGLLLGPRHPQARTDRSHVGRTAVGRAFRDSGRVRFHRRIRAATQVRSVPGPRAACGAGELARRPPATADHRAPHLDGRMGRRDLLPGDVGCVRGGRRWQVIASAAAIPRLHRLAGSPGRRLCAGELGRPPRAVAWSGDAGRRPRGPAEFGPPAHQSSAEPVRHHQADILGPDPGPDGEHRCPIRLGSGVGTADRSA